MRSQAGAIHLLNGTAPELQLVIQQGLPPDIETGAGTLPSGNKLPDQVIEQGGPLIIFDVSTDPRVDWRFETPLQAYVGVPMRARGHILGILSVLREKGQPQFNLEEIALLTSIADQAGVVVESARLHQQAEQSAVMEERARLARDLHDSVTQLLYSVNLFAKAGQEAYKVGDLDQVNNCLAELGEIAQQALREMRLLVYELRPPALEHDGLVGALQHRLDAVEKRAGIQTQLFVNDIPELPGPLEEALYHLAQEALNNALKHAKASMVTVKISSKDRQLELEIADDGSGFEANNAAGIGGLGLISMRERVEKLGGCLTILATPGEGTSIKVNVKIGNQEVSH
jgi:signal transduction histidine kinase